MRSSNSLQGVDASVMLDASRFDFRQLFPVPRDNDRIQAGRHGLLDQKEDNETTDAQWVAFRHAAWSDELRNYYRERRYLLACLQAHVDPGTGLPPRVAGAWSAIEGRIHAEVLRVSDRVAGIMGDYADHFGCHAAASFASFIEAELLADGDSVPVQQALFL